MPGAAGTNALAAPGPTTVVNDVVLGATGMSPFAAVAGRLVAMDSSTGAILSTYNTGTAVYGGFSVQHHCMVVGSGYRLAFGFQPGQTVFGFCGKPGKAGKSVGGIAASTSTSTAAGASAGVVAGVAGVALLVAAAVVLTRRRRRLLVEPAQDPEVVVQVDNPLFYDDEEEQDLELAADDAVDEAA